MKLLTINTHSLIEKNYKDKLEIFVNVISEIKPDIIAMQEVNQTSDAHILSPRLYQGNFKFEQRVQIKSDNHAANINRLLRECGINYNWIWLGIKRGFEKYDEGVALFSLSPIVNAKVITLSKNDDFFDWHTRKALGIKTADDVWYYSTHFGWWKDDSESFKNQWEAFENGVKSDNNIWLMGDFNTTPDGESYKLVKNSSWYDSYVLADEKDNGVTVSGSIAGWCNNKDDKRIDYIFTNRYNKVKSSKVVFNGINKAVVSDHFGVLVTI